MDPTRINWSRRLAELISHDSDIPTDITFKFVKANDGNDEVSAQSNDVENEVSALSNDGDVSAQPSDVEEEVSAHKMILAVVSPMFRKMFYVHNTVDMFAQEIVMEDTTAPAFRIFIDAIYGVAHMQESLKDKSVDEVFGVLYLVTKYDIPELVRAVQDTFSSFPLTMDTVLEVADDVMDYAATFQQEAHQLLLTCAKFLKAKLTHADDVLGLIAENGDKMAVIHKLSVLIGEIAPITIIVSNHCFSPVIKLYRPSNELMENMPMPGLVESSEEESEADDSDEEAWDSVSSCGDSCDCLTGDSEVSDEESQEAAGEDHNVMEAAHLLELHED